MKKLLTIAAFAALVTASHAATLSWQIAGITSPTGVKQGLSVYLFITEQSSDFGAKTTSVDEITSLLKSKGDVSSYVAAEATTTAAGGVPIATGYNGGNFGAGDSLSGFAVVLDAANVASANNYILTDVKHVEWKGATGAQTMRFGSLANATWTAVPEPSTAVLALAGLALLLKRRRA